MRNLIGVCVAGLFGLCLLSWILGPYFGSARKSVQESAREALVDLIGKTRVQHAKAKEAVEAATKKVQKINEIVVDERVGIRMIERNITAAEEEIKSAKDVLAEFERRLAAGQPIVLVSGRHLSEPLIRDRVVECKNKIAVAVEKMSFLNSIREGRKTQLAKLEKLRIEAPAELRKLQQSLNFLEAKLAMYEDLKHLHDDERSSVLAEGFFDNAHDALEKAHAAVDQQLARFDAAFQGTLDSADLAPMDGTPEKTSDQLLTDIRLQLSEISRLQ